jgi:hypothetical protein
MSLVGKNARLKHDRRAILSLCTFSRLSHSDGGILVEIENNLLEISRRVPHPASRLNLFIAARMADENSPASQPAHRTDGVLQHAG